MVKARWALALVVGCTVGAQVYSPQVLRPGQPDATSLAALARSIFERDGAKTDREKAEAIWRFFLADGRFVKPGFWRHLDGWAYEEPGGQSLDPLELIHSYGFGSASQLAGALEAVWKAAGFADARVWLIGVHAAPEVFYGGGYHYFDSDWMGYTTTGREPFRKAPVASVRQLERDATILTGKLRDPNEPVEDAVDYPWYPLALRQGSIESLAKMFAASDNHWLLPFTDAPRGYSPDFTLRPGEKITRSFRPDSRLLFYLPFGWDGKKWREFPIDRIGARTPDGPDTGTDAPWATGQIEYAPPLGAMSSFYPVFGAGFNENLRLPRGGAAIVTRVEGSRLGRAVFEAASPYVIIDGRVTLEARLDGRDQTLTVETSIDGGRTWEFAGTLNGPYRGRWEAKSQPRVRGTHGALSAVGGTHGYLARLTLAGPGAAESAGFENVVITTRFQLNPRTLPELAAGHNDLLYRPGPAEMRRSLPVRLDMLNRFAVRSVNVKYAAEDGQPRVSPAGGKRGEVIFELIAPEAMRFAGFEAGGRFLDLRDPLWPDKFTGQARPSAERLTSGKVAGSLAWSTTLDGEYKTLWNYDDEPKWRDGEAIRRVLRWPETDARVDDLPAGLHRVFVRYRLDGMALDQVRLTALLRAPTKQSPLEITHQWREDGQAKRHVERIEDPSVERRYAVETGPTRSITNDALVLYCPPGK